MATLSIDMLCLGCIPLDEIKIIEIQQNINVLNEVFPVNEELVKSEPF